VTRAADDLLRPIDEGPRSTDGDSRAIAEDLRPVAGRLRAVAGDPGPVAEHSWTVAGHFCAAAEHSWAVAGDSRVVAGHSCAAARDPGTVAGHSRFVAGHRCAVAADSCTVPGTSWAVTEHSCAIAGDSRTVAGDLGTVAGHSRVIAADPGPVAADPGSIAGHSRPATSDPRPFGSGPRPARRRSRAPLALLALAAALGAAGCFGIPEKDHLRIGGAARPEYAPPAGVSLAAKAARFEALADRFVSPLGTLVYVQPATATAFAWRRQSDQAIWTGALLAAESLRYAATREEAALARVRHLLAGTHALTEVTGVRGLYARSLWPAGSIPPSGAEDDHAGAGPLQGYLFRGDVSKDQMSGLICGLALAWFLVDDAEVRDRAGRDAAAFARRLVADDLVIKDVDGEPTTYGDLRGRIFGVPIGLNALITLAAVKLGAQASGDADLARAYQDLLARGYADHAYWTKFQLFGKTNHNNDNMQYLATLPLLFLESDPAVRAKVAAGLERTWVYVRHEGNAWFNEVTMVGLGYDAQAAADARLTLALFPLEKRSFAVDVTGDPRFTRSVFDARGGLPRSPLPLPVNYREETVFAWRDDPYALVSGAGARGDETSAPVDYLLAYWLARYAGFLGAED
jgi:hypothetical protein